MALANSTKVALVIYACLGAEFILRYIYDRPFKNVGHQLRYEPMEKNVKLIVVGLAFEFVFIFIRYARAASPAES